MDLLIRAGYLWHPNSIENHQKNIGFPKGGHQLLVWILRKNSASITWSVSSLNVKQHKWWYSTKYPIFKPLPLWWLLEELWDFPNRNFRTLVSENSLLSSIWLARLKQSLKPLPIGSMGLVDLPTWMVDFYGRCRQIYNIWLTVRPAAPDRIPMNGTRTFLGTSAPRVYYSMSPWFLNIWVWFWISPPCIFLTLGVGLKHHF